MEEFNSKLSIYIPRVFPIYANTKKINSIFKKFNIGEIDRIDFVEKKTKNNTIYYQAFIHFKFWENSQISHNIQEKINDPNQTAKIVYNDPEYWILLKNKNPMTETEIKLEKRIIELENKILNLEKILNAQSFNNSINTNFEYQPEWYNNSINNVSIEQIAEDTSIFHNNNTNIPRTILSRTSNSHEVAYYSDGSKNSNNTNCVDRNNEGENEDNVEDYYDYSPYDTEIIE